MSTAESADNVAQALAEHSREALSLREAGFWIYLLSDAVIFALLFATYAVMARRTAGGPHPKDLFNIGHTFAETMLLLTSSFTFGLASVQAAGGNGNRGKVLAWLAVTFLLGAGFVGLELSEFAGMIAEGAGPQRSGFLSAMFTLVGTHGLHVSFGLLGIVLMSVQIAVSGLAPVTVSRLTRLGLFWHFLDIIWIGVFTFVYLQGLM